MEIGAHISTFLLVESGPLLLPWRTQKWNNSQLVPNCSWSKPVTKFGAIYDDSSHGRDAKFLIDYIDTFSLKYQTNDTKIFIYVYLYTSNLILSPVVHALHYVIANL